MKNQEIVDYFLKNVYEENFEENCKKASLDSLKENLEKMVDSILPET